MVQIVDTEKKLRALVDDIKQQKACAVDTESTGLHLLKDRIITIPISVGSNHYVIPVRLKTQPNVDISLVRKYLNPIFKDKKIVKYFWNYKYDRHLLSNDGMGKFVNFEDGMVIAWLLDENRSKSLKERCEDVDLHLSKFPFSEYFRLRDTLERTESTAEVVDPGRCPTLKSLNGDRELLVVKKEEWRREKEAFKDYKKNVKPMTFAQHSRLSELERELIVYAGEDTLATWELCLKYIPILKNDEPKIWRVYKKIWRPYLDVLFKMERIGYCVDFNYLKKAQQQCMVAIDQLEREVYSLAGRPFNTDGPDLADVIFNQFGCPVLKVSRKTGKPSADADTIELLSREPEDYQHPYGTDGFKPKYPILKSISKLKKLKKLWGTYISPSSKLVQAIYKGRLHPHYNPCGTDTGRLSSSTPNFQNSPRSSPDNFYYRSLFIAPQGYTLGVFDQSQIELRVIADRTKDPKMVEAYCNDEDIHWKTAVGTGLDPAKDRTIAKNLNFGAFYGIGDDKFGTILTVKTGKYVSKEDADNYLRIFFELYSTVPTYQHKVHRQLERDGFVTSYLGRKRRLPEIYSPNRWEKQRAQRQGFNFLIQGGVADIMTYCMLRVYRDKWMRKMGIYLIGQVHDEVHFIVPWGVDYKEFTRRLKSIFEEPFPGYNFAVPLKFEGNDSVAFSWNDAK